MFKAKNTVLLFFLDFHYLLYKLHGNNKRECHPREGEDPSTDKKYGEAAQQDHTLK